MHIQIDYWSLNCSTLISVWLADVDVRTSLNHEFDDAQPFIVRFMIGTRGHFINFTCPVDLAASFFMIRCVIYLPSFAKW